MNIGIIGLGLIGGSIGRATLEKTSHTVFGSDIKKENIIKAKLISAISDELDDERLKTCDLVILALYPHAAIEKLYEIAPKLKAGAIIIDCCGTKRKIVEAMLDVKEGFKSLNFVGVHPMAGREFSGISHSIAGLLDNSFAILTSVKSDMQTLTTVKKYFLELGCIGVEIASADKHDQLISYTSQLVHIVSSSYIKNKLSSEYVGFSAGSFRDITRVAKLHSGMWTELCIENRDYLLEQINELISNLNDFKVALENNDSNRVFELFEEGNRLKTKADEMLRERKKNEKS